MKSRRRKRPGKPGPRERRAGSDPDKMAGKKKGGRPQPNRPMGQVVPMEGRSGPQLPAWTPGRTHIALPWMPQPGRKIETTLSTIARMTEATPMENIFF